MAKYRNYCFTLNNYTTEEVDVLKLTECRFIGWGYEIAPETGTPHLQGLVCFVNPRSLTSVRTINRRWHVEPVRSTCSDAWDYCCKVGKHALVDSVANEIWSIGTLPMDQKSKGECNVERYKRAWQIASDATADIQNIDADILICHYNAVKHIRRDYMPKCELLQAPCGVWIQGKSGCGKTTYTTNVFPDAYLKPINKWWDGYANEDVVVLDDVDKSHSTWIGYFMKKWSDKFPFIAEQKGTSVKIRPKLFVVTSQYHISDVFADDETYEAIFRRFKVIDMFDVEVQRQAKDLCKFGIEY